MFPGKFDTGIPGKFSEIPVSVSENFRKFRGNFPIFPHLHTILSPHPPSPLRILHSTFSKWWFVCISTCISWLPPSFMNIVWFIRWHIFNWKDDSFPSPNDTSNDTRRYLLMDLCIIHCNNLWFINALAPYTRPYVLMAVSIRIPSMLRTYVLCSVVPSKSLIWKCDFNLLMIPYLIPNAVHFHMHTSLPHISHHEAFLWDDYVVVIMSSTITIDINANWFSDMW